MCKEKLQLLQTTKSTVYLYKLLLKSNPVHDIFFKNRFIFFFFFFNAITIIIPRHYYVEDLGLDPCFFFFFKSKSPSCHVVFRITVVINKSVLTWPFDSGRGENVLRVLNGSTGQHTHAYISYTSYMKTVANKSPDKKTNKNERTERLCARLLCIFNLVMSYEII